MDITFNDGEPASSPAAQPITADELAGYLRLGDAQAANAAALSDCIDAATRMFERLTRRTIMQQTLTQPLDAFPDPNETDGMIRLTRGPVSAITKIEYLPPDETAMQTLAASDYTADLNSQPPRIAPKPNWPETEDQPASVAITYTAGANTAADIPFDIKNAITMLAAHYFTNPEGFAAVELKPIPLAVQTVIEQYKLPEVALG